MCDCKACQSGLRPFDDVDAVELARYERAKRINDTKKLAAMLPAWIKAHMASVRPPKPFKFIPGLPPVYPGGLFTVLTPGKPPIPQGQFDSTMDYVRRYDETRSFKNAYKNEVTA